MKTIIYTNSRTLSANKIVESYANSRTLSANEIVESYMYMCIDGHILTKEQKQQIYEIIPICSSNWADEAKILLQQTN